MAQGQQLADEIESYSGWDPRDPDDLHESVQSMHQVTGALQTVFNRWADALDGTRIDPSVPETLREKAGQLAAMMDELEQELGGGIMERRG
jgi:hypothetical protein